MSKDETKGILLCEHDIEYFKYFIKKCLSNARKGKLEESHHDAMAIVLQLGCILGLTDGER